MSNDTDFCDHVSRNVQTWHSAWGLNNDKYRDNMDFAYGDQWEEADLAIQASLQKPAFTCNKIYSFYRSIAGEFVSFRPDYKIADNRVSTAPLEQHQLDVLTDLMREIHHASNVHKIYQQTFRSSFLGGFGAFAIEVSDDPQNPFLKSVRYVGLPDPRCAFFDPAAKSQTKTDGQFAGVTSWVHKDKFKALHGKLPEQDLFVNIDCFDAGSFVDNVLVLDYYERSPKQVKYHMLSNSMVVKDADLKDLMPILERQAKQNGMQLPPTILETKTANESQITHYKIAGDMIIDKAVFPSSRLPVVFCDNDSYLSCGKWVTNGVIDAVRSPQKYLNYIRSELAYTIQTLRREVIVGTPENIRGMEDKIKHVSQLSGFLPFNPDERGLLPTRWPIPEIPQSLIVEYNAALKDIQEAFGMFEANRGQIGNEVSGKAIVAKIGQGDLSNVLYFDNILDAIREGAQIVADIIPTYYDAERKVRTRGKDGTVTTEDINPKSDEFLLKYSALHVEISGGSNFRAQRANELEQLNSVVQSSGMGATLFQLVADQYPRFLDSSIKEVLQERFGMITDQAISELKAASSGQPTPQQQAVQQQVHIEQQRVDASTTNAQANMLKAHATVQDTANDHIATKIKADAEIKKAMLEVVKEEARNPAVQSTAL